MIQIIDIICCLLFVQYLGDAFIPRIICIFSNSVDQELIALHGRHKGKYARNPEGELEVW